MFTHVEDKLLFSCYHGIISVIDQQFTENREAVHTKKDPLNRSLLMVACDVGHLNVISML